jgi:replication initiation protein RepC
MTDLQLTTPFGRRPLSRAQILAQRLVHRVRQGEASRHDPATGELVPPPPVHKWRLYEQALTARPRLGLSDRALTVLHALISFHPEVMLVPGEPIIVHASNARLAARAHGMPIPTLQRKLAELLEAGLISRRDSPNGKRYARRDGEGAVTEAFGLDLAPFAARAAELADHAAAVQAEARAVRVARERATLARRDILKLAEALDQAGDAAGAEGLLARFAASDRRLPRQPTLEAAEALAGRLEALAADAWRLHPDAAGWQETDKQETDKQETDKQETDMQDAGGRDAGPEGAGQGGAAAKGPDALIFSHSATGNASQNEAHNQNQTTHLSEPEPISCGHQGGLLPNPATGVAAGKGAEPAAPERKSLSDSTPAARGITLGLVLQACPQLHDYARGGRVNAWPEALDAAQVMRAALGISPDAWEQAREAMGAAEAAVAVAAILEKGEAIRSPGGYLRRLTAQARERSFSTGPMLMALLAGRGGRARPAGQGAATRGGG